MNCPKCGNNNVIGPRYEKTLWGAERLVYRCACGYRWYEACFDTKKLMSPLETFVRAHTNWPVAS